MNCELIEDGRVVTLNREKMIERLRLHVEKAAELVKETGYHRRDLEAELGLAGLFLAQGERGKARERLGKAKGLLDQMGIRCWNFWVREVERVSGRSRKDMIERGSNGFGLIY